MLLKVNEKWAPVFSASAVFRLFNRALSQLKFEVCGKGSPMDSARFDPHVTRDFRSSGAPEF